MRSILGLPKITILAVIFSIALLLALFAFVSPHMWVASFNFCLLWVGISFLKTSKKVHAALMGTAIVSDLILVLLLQIERNAVQTAASFTLSPLEQAHVLSSLVATLLYFPLMFYGLKLLRRPEERSIYIQRHRALGLAAIAFRTLGFFLMFSMLK